MLMLGWVAVGSEDLETEAGFHSTEEKHQPTLRLAEPWVILEALHPYLISLTFCLPGASPRRSEDLSLLCVCLAISVFASSLPLPTSFLPPP